MSIRDDLHRGRKGPVYYFLNNLDYEKRKRISLANFKSDIEGNLLRARKLSEGKTIDDKHVEYKKEYEGTIMMFAMNRAVNELDVSEEIIRSYMNLYGISFNPRTLKVEIDHNVNGDYKIRLEASKKIGCILLVVCITLIFIFAFMK
jgi:YHS domain-containing protein